MQYLVKKPFRSYGKRHDRGEIVDESAIRSRILRQREGCIVPVVSSHTEGEEAAAAAPRLHFIRESNSSEV